jgi:hypothetical protein
MPPKFLLREPNELNLDYSGHYAKYIEIRKKVKNIQIPIRKWMAKSKEKVQTSTCNSSGGG